MKMHIAGSRGIVAMLLVAVGACRAGESDSKNGPEALFRIGDEVTAADVGLPAYPGAKLSKDASDSSSAADIGLSTPLFGFKIVAVKLETPDKPEHVAVFYRRALEKYGEVLDCSDAAQEKAQSKSGDQPVCDPDGPETPGIVYKVGTEQNQRIVAIKSRGSGTQFTLLHLDMRGKSKQ